MKHMDILPEPDSRSVGLCQWLSCVDMDNASYNEAILTCNVCSFSVRTKTVKIKFVCSRYCSVAVLRSLVRNGLFSYS